MKRLQWIKLSIKINIFFWRWCEADKKSEKNRLDPWTDALHKLMNDNENTKKQKLFTCNWCLPWLVSRSVFFCCSVNENFIEKLFQFLPIHYQMDLKNNYSKNWLTKKEGDGNSRWTDCLAIELMLGGWKSKLCLLTMRNMNIFCGIKKLKKKNVFTFFNVPFSHKTKIREEKCV